MLGPLDSVQSLEAARVHKHQGGVSVADLLVINKAFMKQNDPVPVYDESRMHFTFLHDRIAWAVAPFQAHL